MFWPVRISVSPPLCLGFLFLASLAGCSSATVPAPVPPQVHLVNPRQISTLDSADYQSTLEAIREIRLASEISGRIVAMPVTEGQTVKQGQFLYALDQAQQQATVNADAAEARKNRTNAERYIFLNQQGAVSTKERDYYVTEAIQSRDKLKASIATLGYKNVLAPIPGVVGDIHFKLGDVVQAGTAITSVVDNSRLWVRLNVPGELAYRVKLGMPVILRAPDRNQLVAQGQVSFIGPSLDKERQTLLVKAVFGNADGALRNNQRVNATLVFAQQKVLAIPQQAVLLQAGKPFVFLAVSPQEAKRRLGRTLEPEPLANLPVAIQAPVTLGTLQGGAYPVLEGLTAADTVVVGNLAQLRSGLSVQPATSMLPSGAPGPAAGKMGGK